MVFLHVYINWYTFLFFVALSWFIYHVFGRFFFFNLTSWLVNIWSIRSFSRWMWFFRNFGWLSMSMFVSIIGIWIMNFWIALAVTSYVSARDDAAKEAGWISFLRFFLTLLFIDDNLREVLGFWKVKLSIFSSLSSKPRCCEFVVWLIQFTKIIFYIYFIPVCLINTLG